MQELMQHVSVWLCPNGTNFREYSQYREGPAGSKKKKKKKSLFLLHKKSFMPGIYTSILKDQTLPIYAFPFKGLFLYVRH